MAANAEEIFEQLTTPIGGVPIEQIMSVWSKVEPLLQRVVKPQTGFDLMSVLTALQLGQMQLWVVGDFQGVVVTHVVHRPLQNVLWVQFLAGDHMDDWLDDWITVQEEAARHYNCEAIEFQGRKGWNKIHEKHRDYKPVLTTFRREL